MRDDRLPPSAAAHPGRAASWALLAGALVVLAGALLEPTRAQGPGFGTAQQTHVPTASGGGNADSNNRMIAVTGVDVTGASILYLVDTVNNQLAVYQANGGSSSTQGVKLVGARRITLDLRLDGFNDKTESGGKALGFKDLKRVFETQGHDISDD